MEKSIIQQKSLQFARSIYKICKSLESQKEFIIANQLLRSGTSVGANIFESYFSESTNDYIHKLSISLKEVNETLYWLEFSKLENIIDENVFNKLNYDGIEIRKILISIIKKLKQK